MFSKKVALIIGVIVLIAVNMTALTISSKSRQSSYGPGRIIISLVAPFQEMLTHTIRFARDVWRHYFFLVSAAKERDRLKDQLATARQELDRYREIDLSNRRLRELVNFKQATASSILAAEIIGKDPSTWYKTVIIDKGRLDGLDEGLPVVVPAGIVGQTIAVAKHYAKVLLIIDQNSAVDALIQRTRSRGVVKGDSLRQCNLRYALRKHEIHLGDRVISSGLDGVFPKGLSIGSVTEIMRPSAGIFQDVVVTPFVDFEKIEEVLVMLRPLPVPVESGNDK